MSNRLCELCKRVLSIESFPPSKTRGPRTQPYCSECTAKLAIAFPSLTCKTCKQELPREQFYLKRRCKTGRGDSCKECVKKNVLQWQKDNPERANAKAADWRKAHPEFAHHLRVTAYGKNWYRQDKLKHTEKWKKRQLACDLSKSYGLTFEQ